MMVGPNIVALWATAWRRLVTGVVGEATGAGRAANRLGAGTAERHGAGTASHPGAGTGRGPGVGPGVGTAGREHAADAGPVQSVDRAVAILEILARDGEAGVTEVARELGVHKST